MRKHRHYPNFTKDHFVERLRNFHYGRRPHGLAKDVAPTPKMIASAKSRAPLYMHSAARRRLLGAAS